MDLKVRGDERGSLIAIETGSEAPFTVERAYYMFDTKPGVVRGLHAHRTLRQLAVAVRGGCTMLLDDGSKREAVRLNHPARGLAIGALVWREIRDFSPDCVLLVLADQRYDEGDYIRDYDEFCQAVAAAGRPA